MFLTGTVWALELRVLFEICIVCYDRGMDRTRSALVLTLLGLAAGLFFWLTDPTLGIATGLMSPEVNRIDAARRAWTGTWIGLIGSAIAVVLGLWNISGLRGLRSREA